MMQWIYIGVIAFTVIAPMLMAALVDDKKYYEDLPSSSMDL